MSRWYPLCARPCLTSNLDHRKQKEYTDLYGANSQRGTLTPFLDQAILDGIDKSVLSWVRQFRLYLTPSHFKRQLHFGRRSRRL